MIVTTSLYNRDINKIEQYQKSENSNFEQILKDRDCWINKVQEAENILKPAKIRRDALITYFKSICHHPIKYVIKNSEYYPGTYLDKSYNVDWYHCNLCNQNFDRTENHLNGSYG